LLACILYGEHISIICIPRTGILNAAICMSSWSKPLSLTDAVHQLDGTSSVHRLYNALVVIRTNYSKGRDSQTALRHHGGDVLRTKFVLICIFYNICYMILYSNDAQHF